jgi:pilus assembly protein CpaE
MEDPVDKMFRDVTRDAHGREHPQERDVRGVDGLHKGYADVPGLNPSVILICPNAQNLAAVRRSLEAQRATIVQAFADYPLYTQLDTVLELDSDAIVVEIDSDPDVALDLVEALCTRKASTTVMVYSASGAPDQMVRSMRAGAREFLTNTSTNTVLQEALVRAASRRSQQTKKLQGNIAVFLGSKGGCGVTTLATNFALALRAETSGEVALLDLNPQIGDVATLLGVTPQFTIAEALDNAKRLDLDLIATLVTKHRSGVALLASPDSYNPSARIDNRAVGKLMDVVRTRYPHVVVDAGRSLGEAAESLFEAANTIYLVTQLDVLSLRNAQRMIAHIQRAGNDRIELVVNRYDPRKVEFDDQSLAKVLGIAPKWKIPNDFGAAYRTSNSGTPLIEEKSPAANALRILARAASGKPLYPEKKKGFSLFGL